MLNSTKPVQGLRNNRGREWPFFTDLMYRPFTTVKPWTCHKNTVMELRKCATQLRNSLGHIVRSPLF